MSITELVLFVALISFFAQSAVRSRTADHSSTGAH